MIDTETKNKNLRRWRSNIADKSGYLLIIAAIPMLFKIPKVIQLAKNKN